MHVSKTCVNKIFLKLHTKIYKERTVHLPNQFNKWCSYFDFSEEQHLV